MKFQNPDTETSLDAKFSQELSSNPVSNQSVDEELRTIHNIVTEIAKSTVLPKPRFKTGLMKENCRIFGGNKKQLNFKAM